MHTIRSKTLPGLNVHMGMFDALLQKTGKAILSLYGSEHLHIAYKKDGSVVTNADLYAHRIIVSGLQTLTPAWPVLSEEGQLLRFEERRHWDMYWLIDPLDGTKDFIKQSKNFSVNIALIRKNNPIFGMVYFPACDVLYFGGSVFNGAWKKKKTAMFAYKNAILQKRTPNRCGCQF